MDIFNFGVVVVGACCNPDESRLILAGRQILKIITTTNLTEIATLHSRANSISDVKWSPTKENLIVTSSASGNIIFWNLERMYSKSSTTFIDLKRAVNSVDFSRSNSNHLIGGTLDGKIKLIDIRKAAVEMSFETKHETCIRQLQFDKFEGIYVSSACDNGNITIWDLRKTDSPVNDFGAHNGPVFSVDWHPIDRHFLASGGRDRTIKIWNFNEKNIVCLEQLHCLSAISKIKWRPLFKHQLACCSLLFDFSVNIWDIRRAYVPSSSFSSHHDIVTDICWLNNGSSILSTSKDGSVKINKMEEASNPDADRIPVALTLHPIKNQMIYCLSTLNSQKDPSLKISTLSAPVSISCFSEYFNGSSTSSTSSSMDDLMDILRLQEEPLSMKKNTSSSVTESKVSLINLNQQPSKPLKGRKKSRLIKKWPIKFDNKITSSQKMNDFQANNDFVKPLSHVLLIKYHFPNKIYSNLLNNVSKSCPSSITSLQSSDISLKFSLDSFGCLFESIYIKKNGYLSIFSQDIRDIIKKSTDELINKIQDLFYDDFIYMAKNYVLYGKSLDHVLTNNILICQHINRSDLVLVWKIIKQLLIDWSNNLAQPSSVEKTPSTLIIVDYQSIKDSVDCLVSNETGPKKFHCKMETDQKQEEKHNSNIGSLTRNQLEDKLESILQSLIPKSKNFYEYSFSCNPPKIDSWFQQLLWHLIETGDIPTAIALWMIIKKYALHVVPTLYNMNRSVEEWFYIYLDILKRCDLWNERAFLIKNCQLESISSISQTSTGLHLECSYCKSSLMEKGSFCRKCKKICSICSVCLLPTFGLVVGCTVCGHSGHPKHLINWFSQNNCCPFFNCQHMCSYYK